MKKSAYILSVFFTIIAFSCKNENSEIDKIFSDIRTKYSNVMSVERNKDLSHLFSKQVTYKTEDLQLEIQIWEANADNFEPNFIVFFKRNEKQIVGIPFFSNNYPEFWDFKNEVVNTEEGSKKSFEYEYNSMLEKLHLDSMYSTSYRPISFLSYYMNWKFFKWENISMFSADTSISSDGKISGKEIERKKIMSKNLSQIEKILYNNDQYKPPNFGFLDKENGRIIIPIYKYNEEIKRGKFTFEIFRDINCNDQIPLISI